MKSIENMSSEEIYKRLFISIKFDNEAVNYKNLNMVEKFNFIKKITINSLYKISNKLKLIDIVIDKTHFTNIIYFTIYTIPSRNHPIVGFISLNNYADEIILIRPVGKKKYHISFQYPIILFERNYIKSSVYVYGLYLSAIKSINIRKEEILLDKQHSLLNCHNIKGCITKTKKNNINPNMKTKHIKHMRQMAINILKKYFNYLEKFNFTEAHNLLGDKTDNSPLNKTFRKLKKIHGHLEIFISLYDYVYKIKEYYLKITK